MLIITYSGKYSRLVHGEMDEELRTFLGEEHSLEDYKDKIKLLMDLQKDVSLMDDVLWFHMFRLECRDIKHGLREMLVGLVNTLVQDLAHRHMEENAR